MIPYIEAPAIKVSEFISLQPFGVLILIGCIVGYFVGEWRARQADLELAAFRGLTVCILIPAFILSRWLAEVLYYPDSFPRSLWRDPFSLAPMSSYGGFVGAALGGLVYLYHKRLARKLVFADAGVSGWLFGRLGCTLVHDHPGVKTDFFLAVRFPDGPRHDLGFYEFLITIALNVLVVLIHRRRVPDATILGIVCLCYGVARFLLDFLRIGDQRYLDLTPAQYGSGILFVFGAAVLVMARRESWTGAWRSSSGGEG